MMCLSSSLPPRGSVNPGSADHRTPRPAETKPLHPEPQSRARARRDCAETRDTPLTKQSCTPPICGSPNRPRPVAPCRLITSAAECGDDRLDQTRLTVRLIDPRPQLPAPVHTLRAVLEDVAQVTHAHPRTGGRRTRDPKAYRLTWPMCPRCRQPRETGGGCPFRR